ncbi:MAG: 50S ribosomal protein L18 [Alphaproteobacteria bacterium]|nr:50S ribosomal protein L18 [Alphaproteobacteria bacterium]MBE8220888.1 50S ribosomal protein L18 [Alphaproteobacteria bacterium]
MAHSTINDRRKYKVRRQLKKVAGERPRLSVFRSSKHIYAQIIDDAAGRTLAAASTKDKDFDGKGCNKEAAGIIGKNIATRAKAAGVKAVIFDRGGYIYHGRVKALAEAAREAGLNF